MPWAKRVDDERKTEKQLQEQVTVVNETIDFYVTIQQQRLTVLLEVAALEIQLSDFRKGMHPGYYFVGDIGDMRTSVRQMTLKNQSKDQHMYQMCAY